VDALQEQNKQLSKEIKNCDKYVKNWPAYKGLEDAVKNPPPILPVTHPPILPVTQRERVLH